MPLPLHAARQGSLRIAAHRGFSRHFPENTILAYQKGVDAGANECEIDLMLTRDDKIIVMHDRTAQIVDEEVKSILTQAYSDATRILTERRTALDRLANALLERETLEREFVEMVVAGQPLPPYVPPPPTPRADTSEQEKEKPSQRASGGMLRNPPPEPAGA